MDSVMMACARARVVGAAAGLVLAATAGAQGLGAWPEPTWPGLGRLSTRQSAADLPLAGSDGTSAAVRWRVTTDTSPGGGGVPLRWMAQSGVVTQGGRLYALARRGAAGNPGSTPVLACVDANTGAVLWTAPVPTPVFDSISTPALREEAGEVLVATGNELRAHDGVTGALRWRTVLGADIVNASPVVTDDLGPADRAFVTDYGGFGFPGFLHCVNVDAFDAARNPYQPGEVVWSAEIGSPVGNTPAYERGVVYVATYQGPGGSGSVYAFDASSAGTPTPSPLWRYDHAGAGFFGGVTVAPGPGGDERRYVYGATYGFSGGLLNSELVKLDARTGALVWSTPSGRTNSTPVVLPDGRVVLSAGIQGFGSAPSVQVFRDAGASATLLWDSALATWSDANSNGVIDPGEALSIGGYTVTPLVTLDERGRALLVTGDLGDGSEPGGHAARLVMVDLSRVPTDPAFVRWSVAHAGASPAALGRGVYSIGSAGLAAVGPAPARFDVSLDGFVDIDDLHAWNGAPPLRRDVNRDGVTDGRDQSDLSRVLQGAGPGLTRREQRRERE